MIGRARAVMLAGIAELQAHGLLRPSAQDSPEQGNGEIALDFQFRRPHKNANYTEDKSGQTRIPVWYERVRETRHGTASGKVQSEASAATTKEPLWQVARCYSP